MAGIFSGRTRDIADWSNCSPCYSAEGMLEWKMAPAWPWRLFRRGQRNRWLCCAWWSSSRRGRHSSRPQTPCRAGTRTCCTHLHLCRICQNICPPKTVIFQRGEVHKTNGFWWVIFQRGEYIKPMAFDGWFFKGGSTQNRWLLMGDFSKGGVHKTNGFWWVLEYFLIASKNLAPGAFISANTVYKYM